MGDVTRTDDKQKPDTPERDAAATDEQIPHGCCGGPAPPGVDACCALDAAVKSGGGTGCGCAAPRAEETGPDT